MQVKTQQYNVKVIHQNHTEISAKPFETEKCFKAEFMKIMDITTVQSLKNSLCDGMGVRYCSTHG